MKTTLRSLMLLLMVVGTCAVSFAHENTPTPSPTPHVYAEPPTVDLLKMKGSQPSLATNSTAGVEGITSYKISDLFKRGPTVVKPYEVDPKYTLPTGYTLFNKLAYKIESEAVSSGPNDVVFRIPSATTPDTFAKLRILYADGDPAEPEKPLWRDASLTPDGGNEFEYHIAPAELKKLMPDFASRTLHAYMEQEHNPFIVALKDSAIARDRFTADLSVTASVSPQSVIEGKEITYTFKVTNKGPDAATSIAFSTQIDPAALSLDPSQGKCRFDAQNIYCNLGSLEKGATATITYHGRARWEFSYDGQPVQPALRADGGVHSAEGDPDYKSNSVSMETPLLKDHNQAPVVTIIKPKTEQFFPGPDAAIDIVATAHDEDGSIAKVEFFNNGLLIGPARLTGPDTYEFRDEHVAFGRHVLDAVATDNQGRPQKAEFAIYMVNGPVEMQIIEPKPNFVMNPPHDVFVVKLKANNPKGSIKKLVVHVSEYNGSGSSVEAQPVGGGEYLASFKEITLTCFDKETCHVWAVATDDAGIETHSAAVDFLVNQAPSVQFYFRRSDTRYELKDGAEFVAGAPINLSVSAGDFIKGGIVKVEFYVDGKLLVIRENEMDEKKIYQWKTFDLRWKPKPGTYTLTANAFDVYGAVGKSMPVRVIVK